MLPLPIECPSCSHGNPAGSNYCNACGMPVGFTWCPHCDAVNRSNAAHCHKCGEPFAVSERVEAPTVPAVATPAPADVEVPPDAARPQPRRSVGLRVAMTSVLLVALAVPAYLSQQDPAPSPALATAGVVAPPAAPVASPAIEPEAAAPTSPEASDAHAAPAPSESKPSPSAKAKQRSSTRKPSTTRKQSSKQAAARGVSQR
jgi:hypothetical protein